MTTLVAHYGLLIVALIIFCGEIGLPTLVPGEIALLFAGSQVIRSPLALIGAIVLFGVIDAVATTTIHVASRTGGNRLLLRLLRRLQSNHDQHEEVIARWRRRLGGHDQLVVFVTRMIPMFRLYASITTGLIRIRFRDFAQGAWPAAFVWATTPLTIGYVMRGNIATITSQYASTVQWVLLGSVTVSVGLAIAAWLRHAGPRPHVMRRLRFLLGAAAVLGAAVRLLSMTLGNPGIAGHQVLIPSLPSVATWTTIISLVTLALIWIAAQDLRVICARHHHGHIGTANAATWVGLVLMLGLATATTTVPAMAL
jgi:membrane protein DedA with SNARE-associated domain